MNESPANDLGGFLSELFRIFALIEDFVTEMNIWDGFLAHFLGFSFFG